MRVMKREKKCQSGSGSGPEISKTPNRFSVTSGSEGQVYSEVRKQISYLVWVWYQAWEDPSRWGLCNMVMACPDRVRVPCQVWVRHQCNQVCGTMAFSDF